MHDFENQDTSLPNGFDARLGARIQAPAEIWSSYSLDSTVFHSGAKSLRLSSNSSTTSWYVIGKQIPSIYSEIIISYFVKGRSLRKEGKQFNNCYVGLILTDRNGNKQFRVNSYDGTFEWRRGTLQLSHGDLRSIIESGSRIDFAIFLSKSGEFWIDDLEFELLPLSSSSQPVSPTPEVEAEPAASFPALSSFRGYEVQADERVFAFSQH